MLFNRSCITFVNSVLFCLLSFSNSSAEIDSAANKSLEKRLHTIYVSHYNRPVADSEWFTILEAIEVQKHSVQAGDTLWGISKVYFGDGNYWSKLWSVNKSITNPHLIFVGDVIKFHTGSFDSPPGIDIEKNSPEDVTNSQASTTDGGSTAIITEATGDRPLVPIPDFFEKSTVVERTEEAPLIFVPRPKIVYKAEFALTRDILDQPAEVVGEVKSLGQGRIVTAEGSLIMIQSSADLTLGSTYTILKRYPPETSAGYPIHIQAIVNIARKIDSELYEGRVVKQYESIEIGDSLSTYQLQVVTSNTQGVSAKEVPIKILAEQRSLWSAGDMVFFKTVDDGSVATGDLLRINNKYVDNVEFYVTNGYMKVVSVHPPFATGVIVTSREHIRPNSVSAPTYTGWGFW